MGAAAAKTAGVSLIPDINLIAHWHYKLDINIAVSIPLKEEQQSGF